MLNKLYFYTMKYIFFILFSFFTLSLTSQSVYTAKAVEKFDFKNGENFIVESNYLITITDTVVSIGEVKFKVVNKNTSKYFELKNSNNDQIVLIIDLYSIIFKNKDNSYFEEYFLTSN